MSNNSHNESFPPGILTDTPEVTIHPQTNTATQQATQPDHRNNANPYLDIPSSHIPSRRRSSLESSFSDLSELSYLSHEIPHSLNLHRQPSNQSTYSSTSTSNSPPLEWRSRLSSLYQSNYGALLVLFSQLFGCGMNVATRLLEQPGPHGPPMHPFQILLARQSLTALCCTLYALSTKSIPYFPMGPPDRKVRLLLVMRGLFGFFGVFGIYFSLLYLPLSEATVLTFLAPILTCYLCSVVLEEGGGFSRQQQLAGFVSLSGVVLIARPVSLFVGMGGGTDMGEGMIGGVVGNSTTVAMMMGRDEGGHEGDRTGDGFLKPTPSQHLLAIGISMVGVCGATGAITCIRAIGTRAHAFISVNYFSVMSSIVSLVAILVFPSVSFRLPANLQEWVLLLSLGICGFCLQGLLTMGLAYAPKAEGKMKEEVSGSAAVSGNDIEMQAPGSSARPSKRVNRRKIKKGKVKASSSPSSGTKATSMLYTQMLFALTADRVFFGSVPDVWSWIGSGLILAGAIWVAAARDTVKKEGAVVVGEEGEVGNIVSSSKDGGEERTIGEANIDVNGKTVVVSDSEQIGLLTGGLDDDEMVDDRLRR